MFDTPLQSVPELYKTLSSSDTASLGLGQVVVAVLPLRFAVLCLLKRQLTAKACHCQDNLHKLLQAVLAVTQVLLH